MLSPARADDDDDNHLCIKCNATVTGLDNYIKHRKERCAKTKYALDLKHSTPKNEDVTRISSLDPNCDLGADVFFQSLELQSSSKRNLHGLTPPISTGGKTSTATSKINNPLAIPSTSHNRRLSPIEPSARGEDWIGGHSLRIVSNVDNQTKLINAVANISGVVRKDILTSSYNLPSYDYKPDDDSNDDSDDTDDDEDDEPPSSGGKWKPSPHHTGGKWQPGGTDVVHHWTSQQLPTPEPENIEDWDIREEHTGGKWKPVLTQPKLVIDEDRDEDYDVPPPGHTKGKWVPGATQQDKTQIMQPIIQTRGSVQYWCGPCNRRLGSRAIYEKHLMSNLHLRKTLLENDLEFSGHMGPAKIIGKRSPRPSQYINNTLYTQVQRKKRKSDSDFLNPRKTRNRRPYFLHCPGCKSRVRSHLMGKHLISHYHFRKASISGDVYSQLILDNIEAIVHQSPFQCSPCKFYTNWLSNFMQHWFSDEHERMLNSIDGRLWCSFCKFECETSSAMLQHMSSDEHGEVVAVINRSMPIIIRKKTILSCELCKMEFRYNIELKWHSKMSGHPLQHTASDIYQELHKCQLCSIPFKSSLALAAHLKKKHKQRAYLCLVCSLSFGTSSEAKVHRFSQEHRTKRKEKMRERGVPIKDLSKKCPYCFPVCVLKNVLELKDHITRIHPDITRKCPKCGKPFLLPQEVTAHIRSKACVFQVTQRSDILDPKNNRMLWHCSQCLFLTDSQAECLFHEALHSNPVPRPSKAKASANLKTVLKYECPLCEKCFRKPSLRHHLRQHTLERPFRCSLCSANFTRQSSMFSHMKSLHGMETAPVEPIAMKTSDVNPAAADSKPNGNDFSCPDCGAKFSTKHSLGRHGAVHGKGASAVQCPHAGCEHEARAPGELRAHEAAAHGTRREHACRQPGCTYASKTVKQLARHKRIHTERLKKYACSFCPFKSDQSSHLKRHALCHAGTKPYQCPHCQFTCASLENLRKHVLKSSRHPGKPLYECCECPPAEGFCTNLATEFRSHLVRRHSDKYNSKTAVEYVAKFCYRKDDNTYKPVVSG